MWDQKKKKRKHTTLPVGLPCICDLCPLCDADVCPSLLIQQLRMAGIVSWNDPTCLCDAGFEPQGTFSPSFLPCVLAFSQPPPSSSLLILFTFPLPPNHSILLMVDFLFKLSGGCCKLHGC